MPGAGKNVQASLENLSLSSSDQKTPVSPPTPEIAKATVAESWDDELSSGDETKTKTPHRRDISTEFPIAPPPTPISPTSSTARREYEDIGGPWKASDTLDDGSRRGLGGARPEKTDAVAKRMIAAGLGVRAPKKTEEQREYEKAIKDKEMKKRAQEREAQRKAKEDTEKAKSAIWED
ncbi:MAG: hypothetical protein M1837_000415 [Sclerophora amabilis]|nr:MAG: hypothetical protein M1837_000415 [Sclerophora amabilis]